MTTQYFSQAFKTPIKIIYFSTIVDREQHLPSKVGSDFYSQIPHRLKSVLSICLVCVCLHVCLEAISEPSGAIHLLFLKQVLSLAWNIQRRVDKLTGLGHPEEGRQTSWQRRVDKPTGQKALRSTCLPSSWDYMWVPGFSRGSYGSHLGPLTEPSPQPHADRVVNAKGECGDILVFTAPFASRQ